MPEYVLVDGPLAGHTFGSSDGHARGERIAIEVVDVAQGPGDAPRYDYLVESLPAGGRPGRLLHAGP